MTETTKDVHARIERSLHTRSAPVGTLRGKLEHVAKVRGDLLWTQLKRRPLIGVVMVGGAGLALATAVGVGELLIGLVAGYSAYQVLREGVAPREAVEQIVRQLEKLD